MEAGLQNTGRHCANLPLRVVLYLLTLLPPLVPAPAVSVDPGQAPGCQHEGPVEEHTHSGREQRDHGIIFGGIAWKQPFQDTWCRHVH
jgi:hypothetical protein